MADSILKIRTQDGDKPIGYPGLADKPVANKTLDVEGAFADAKVVGDKFKEVKAETDSLKEDIVANSNELYNKEKEEIAVEPSDYNLLENKVAYIDTKNEIAMYDNANAYVMQKNSCKWRKI